MYKSVNEKESESINDCWKFSAKKSIKEMSRYVGITEDLRKAVKNWSLVVKLKLVLFTLTITKLIFDDHLLFFIIQNKSSVSFDSHSIRHNL